MTRADWSAIAAVIRQELDDWESVGEDGNAFRLGGLIAINCLATQMAARLRSKHPRFDVERFLSECGVKRP